MSGRRADRDPAILESCSRWSSPRCSRSSPLRWCSSWRASAGGRDAGRPAGRGAFVARRPVRAADLAVRAPRRRRARRPRPSRSTPRSRTSSPPRPCRTRPTSGSRPHRDAGARSATGPRAVSAACPPLTGRCRRPAAAACHNARVNETLEFLLTFGLPTSPWSAAAAGVLVRRRGAGPRLPVDATSGPSRRPDRCADPVRRHRDPRPGHRRADRRRRARHRAGSERARSSRSPSRSLGRLARLRERLARSGSPLGTRLLAVLSRDHLTEDDWDELEETLLLADVGAGPTGELIDALRTRVRVGGPRPVAVRDVLLRERAARARRPEPGPLAGHRADAQRGRRRTSPRRRPRRGRQRHRQDDDRRQARPGPRRRGQQRRARRGRHLPRRGRRPAHHVGRPGRRPDRPRPTATGPTRPPSPSTPSAGAGRPGPTSSSSTPPAGCRTRPASWTSSARSRA